MYVTMKSWVWECGLCDDDNGGVSVRDFEGVPVCRDCYMELHDLPRFRARAGQPPSYPSKWPSATKQAWLRASENGWDMLPRATLVCR